MKDYTDYSGFLLRVTSTSICSITRHSAAAVIRVFPIAGNVPTVYSSTGKGISSDVRIPRSFINMPVVSPSVFTR